MIRKLVATLAALTLTLAATAQDDNPNLVIESATEELAVAKGRIDMLVDIVEYNQCVCLNWLTCLHVFPLLLAANSARRMNEVLSFYGREMSAATLNGDDNCLWAEFR